MKNIYIRIRSALLIFVVFISVIGFQYASAQTLEPVTSTADTKLETVTPDVKTDTAVVTNPAPAPQKPVAKVSSKSPIIKTEKTPYGNSITITYPENYSGEVSTSFDGNEWQTNTKEYTEEDMKKMQDDIKKRQEAMQKYFEAQQKFFAEMWSNWPKFPVFPF